MKKPLSMVLAGLLAFSMAACSTANTATPAPTTDNSVSAAPTVAPTPEPVKKSNLYGFDEPVNIKIGVSYAAASDFKFYGGETVTDNAWMKLYKEKNIIPDILYEVDPSQVETKLSTAIMSGNYPDIFQTTPAEYKTYVESGVVADITDVFEMYASDELKEYMAIDDGMAIDALKVDGKLYALPKVTYPISSTNMMFIRQDWLDKLGLAIPQTMEELKAVALAFTHDDPDGNSKNDTYGLALDGMNIINNQVGSTDPIFNAFGSYLGTNGMTFIENDNGEIVWGGANSESMKAALQWLRDLYEEGALAKDFITMDSQSVFQETGASRCGIWFGPDWGAMNPAKDAAQNDIKAHVVAAPIPDGINQGGTKSYLSSNSNTIYCVSSKHPNPEVLVKLWNLSVKYQHPVYATPEEYNMYYGDSANFSGWKTAIIAGGPPNLGQATFNKLKESLISGDLSKLNTKDLENYTSIKTYMDAVKAGTFDPKDTTHQRGLSLYTVYGDPLCAWETHTKRIAEDLFILSPYNSLPSGAVTDAIPTLKKLLVETIVKITTGADSVDSYDTFLETWYAMGGQDAINEANGK